MSECCLIKKVATVEVYENKNEVRAYGFMTGDRNTPVMEVKFRHLWGEKNLSTCKLRWIIVDDVGSLLVGEVPISEDNKALIELPNQLFTGERRMKVQLTVASCDGERILNLQQFTDLKVINNLATDEIVEPVYNLLINTLYDETQKQLDLLEESYTEKYGSLDSLYRTSKANLEEYMITAENGGNADSVRGYIPTNFSRIESTINDLINSASSKYKVGDVVDLQGYYEAGDGAHHKRKIEATNDGSGVQLANGLWANIIHDREINVSWFGVKLGLNEDVDGVHNTTILEKVLAYNKSNYDVLKFPAGYINIITLKFDGFADKKIIFNNTFLMGRTTTEQESVVRVLGFANSYLGGKLFIHANMNTFYKSALYIYSEKGNETNFSSFENISIFYIKLGLKIGRDAMDDSLLSENAFNDIKVSYCAKALEFNGSQNVNTFVNCQFITGGQMIDDAFGYGEDSNCITVNGGSPTFVGGEIVAHAHNPTDSSLLSINPCDSPIYGKDYPKIIVSSVHIETGKKLFTINNSNGSGRISTVNFDNCGGFSYLRPDSNFSEILDPNYDGLIRIRNCNFYSHTFQRAALNLYSVSPFAKLDIDISSFTKGFVQGRAGIVGGIFRESNAESISCRLTLGNTNVGQVDLARVEIYNPNYQDIIKNGQIIIPNGCRTITIFGFTQKSTNTDFTIRRNGIDIYYIMNTNSNVSCVIPVKSGDIISMHSYAETNIINSLLRISLGVDFEYTPITLKEMFYNPLISEEARSSGIYEEYKEYINKLHEYESKQTAGVVIVPSFSQEPEIPESVKIFSEKYKLI